MRVAVLGRAWLRKRTKFVDLMNDQILRQTSDSLISSHQMGLGLINRPPFDKVIIARFDMMLLSNDFDRLKLVLMPE